ncbi:hypothetical protein FB451DRAFT_1461153 [Mycena latifolia]|nr:hypothetical protein FB451DRAFT_1461153 [Mycena latifolia]
MCFLPPVDTAQYASHPPARRTAVGRFGYRIQKTFTLHRYTPLPTALWDNLSNFRGLATEPRFAVEKFVETLLMGNLALPEAVVEAVVFYQAKRREGAGDAPFVVCHLRHPHAPRFRISLLLGLDVEANWERATGASGAPGPVLRLTMMTTGSHARLLGEAHRECRSPTFPQGDTHPAPMIMDFLVVAQLVGERESNSKDRATDRSAATVVYAALQELFDGRSKDELARANESGLDTKTTLHDDDSCEEKEVGAIVDAFPSARAELQSRLDKVRLRRRGHDIGAEQAAVFREAEAAREAVLREKKAALEVALLKMKVDLLKEAESAALRARLVQLGEFVGNGFVVMSARRK